MEGTKKAMKTVISEVWWNMKNGRGEMSGMRGMPAKAGRKKYSRIKLLNRRTIINTENYKNKRRQAKKLCI
jgi:hypothetical protein